MAAALLGETPQEEGGQWVWWMKPKRSILTVVVRQTMAVDQVSLSEFLIIAVQDHAAVVVAAGGGGGGVVVLIIHENSSHAPPFHLILSPLVEFAWNAKMVEVDPKIS